MSISKDFASLANQGVANTEFSVLDGVTATTAELNKLAGATVSTVQLNALDVSTASGASATTFLRGDATWQTAGSTDAGDLDTGTLLAARLPAGSIVQVVTFEIDANGDDIAVTGGSPGTEITTSLRFSIVPKLAGSKIIVSYSTVRTYLDTSGTAQMHLAIGHEVMVGSSTQSSPTALTLLGQLVTSGGHSQHSSAYFFLEETGASSTNYYFETFHSPTYTLTQKIWYSPIAWVNSGTGYFSLDSDVRCKITEIKG